MKKLIFVFSLITVSVARSQTLDFHANVTNLWYQGGESRSNVLSIANARLAINTNDIAGLILKYEFLVEFIELPSVSNAAQRVLDVGATISSPHFRDEFPSYTNDIHAVLRAIPMYPPSEIPKDKLKALLPHKWLVADDIIKALQDDGYFY